MGDMNRMRLWAQAHEACERYSDELNYDGNCYETAFRIIMDGDVVERELRDWRLVHALVENATQRHGHAWVEVDGWAIDFASGEERVVPADEYRRAVKASDVREYTWDKAAGAAVRGRNFGAWHHDGGPEPLAEVVAAEEAAIQERIAEREGF